MPLAVDGAAPPWPGEGSSTASADGSASAGKPARVGGDGLKVPGPFAPPAAIRVPACSAQPPLDGLFRKEVSVHICLPACLVWCDVKFACFSDSGLIRAWLPSSKAI
ncbi:hypothetical protein E2562_019950 [Oryza meyeriana var. granulata]|uniref:Uncharacterized protein n=1 Tax=Oryza meyeriana var. granulata TaxID=110450 RepID=A0A6G1CG31_9ORYZ|nr:hypothetical protein E2562_019950 [Oryza meyeriana var. granulata]